MIIHKRWVGVGLCSILLILTVSFFQQKAGNVGDLQNKTIIPVADRVQALAYDENSEMLYVGSYQNRVDGLLLSGEKKWEFPTKNVVSDLVLGPNDTLYASSDDQHIYVLDRFSGTLVNDFHVQSRVYDIDIDSTGSFMVVSAGITATKHFIYKYSLQKGELLWKILIPATCHSVSFSSDGSRIFVGNNRSELIALDSDGKELFTTTVNTEIRGLAPKSNDQGVTVATKYGNLYDIDSEGVITRTEAFNFSDTLNGFAYDKKTNLFTLGGTAGEFYVLSSDWDVLYNATLPVSISTFAFCDDTLFIGSLGEPVYGISLDTFLTSRTLAGFAYWLNYLVVALGLVLLVSLVCSFQYTRTITCQAGKALNKHKTAYLLLLPTFIMLFLFMYLPIGEAFFRAFTDWSVRSKEIRFIGFENFRRMVTEGYFLIGLKNLFLFGVADMIKVVTIPLLVAELVFALRSPTARYWFRFFFVLPLVVPMIVTILMWKNIYDPTIGLLNQLLGVMHLEGLQRVWLGEAATARGSIIGINFPWIDGFAFLVYYGGLINIPTQLFEAAEIDGAGRWWNFTRVHLPLLSPQFKILIILKFIGAIQNFMPIYILTGGGPGTATYVPGLELYYHATTFGNYGYACALGVAMFVFIFIGTFFNMKIRTQSQN
jgi:ABC-type sugar transport system permease subunit/outer membrane protein assembly factor BamB